MTRQRKRRIVPVPLRRLVAAAAFPLALMFPGTVGAVECWQGWGYFVEPGSLAFKSSQTLYVTDGPVDWDGHDWIRLYPIDPDTGLRDSKRKPVLVRPKQPSRQGGGVWGTVVDDVAEVLGSDLSMLLRLSHIKSSEHAATRNDRYSRWACGLG